MKNVTEKTAQTVSASVGATAASCCCLMGAVFAALIFVLCGFCGFILLCALYLLCWYMPPRRGKSLFVPVS